MGDISIGKNFLQKVYILEVVILKGLVENLK